MRPDRHPVHIPDDQDKPYRANGRVYVRIDREVHEATREEIGRLMFESGRVQYELQPAMDAELSELDDALLIDYFVSVRKLPYPADVDERARLLVNRGFATRHAGALVPTVAGLLLFGARPQDRLPAATLRCAFFYGLHRGAQLRDRADVVGPLTKLADDGTAFVGRNRRLVPRMEGVRRPPGDLEPRQAPAPMTLERLGYDQFSRNRLIANVLVERGSIEEVGLGIRRMREEMRSLSLPAPDFREDGFSFVITLHSIARLESAAPAPDRFRQLLEQGGINDRQYRGLLYLLEHGSITRRAYVHLTDAPVRTATRDLADLVARGLVERSGSRGRQSVYQLA